MCLFWRIIIEKASRTHDSVAQKTEERFSVWPLQTVGRVAALSVAEKDHVLSG